MFFFTSNYDSISTDDWKSVFTPLSSLLFRCLVWFFVGCSFHITDVVSTCIVFFFLFYVHVHHLLCIMSRHCTNRSPPPLLEVNPWSPSSPSLTFSLKNPFPNLYDILTPYLRVCVCMCMLFFLHQLPLSEGEKNPFPILYDILTLYLRVCVCMLFFLHQLPLSEGEKKNPFSLLCWAVHHQEGHTG